MKIKLLILILLFVGISTAQTWTTNPAAGTATAILPLNANTVLTAGITYGMTLVNKDSIYNAGFWAGKQAIDTLAIYTKGFKAGQISMIDTVTIELQGRMRYIMQGNKLLIIDTLKLN